MMKVGIVGCGGIAQVHAQALSAYKGTQLAACADIRPERAQAMAEAYGCQAYDSLEAMLDAEALDAVHICTPHVLHTPMAAQLAEKGLPIFTEKPPAIDRVQWKRLEEIARRVPLGVCFQNRYNPSVEEAHRLVESGRYDALLGARAFVTWRREAPYYTESGWRGAWASEGGGALINQSIHTLDLMIGFMGRPEKIETRMCNHHLSNVIEVEDTVEAWMLCGGKPALFYATTAYVDNAPILLELQMEKAVLRLEGSALELRQGEAVERRVFDMPTAMGKDYWGSGHYACIVDFYECLAAGKTFRNSLSAVRSTMETVLCMYEQGKAQMVRKDENISSL